MNTINFTARLVDNPKIKQRTSFLKYEPLEVSIVEFDNTNSQDLQTLNRTSSEWGEKGAIYAEEIFFRAHTGLKKSSTVKNHYYALTTQKQNFKDLNSDNILGLMMFQEKIDNNNEIAYLEVKPTTSKSNNLIRKYKQVGKALVEFVQSKFPLKDIDVWSDYSARNFYKKFGFNQNSSEVCDLCWKVIK